MMGRKILVLAVVLVVGLVLTAHAAGAGPVIRFYDKVEVAGDNITLGDIADLKEVPGEVREQLAAVVVGRSPLVGNERTLVVGYLEVRLRQAGFDPDQFSLQGGKDGIRVVRAGRVIAGSEIAAAVRQVLAPAGEQGTEDISIEPPGDVVVPHGDLKIEVSPVGGRGSHLVPVDIMVDGRLAKRVLVRVELKVSILAVVARRDLACGEVLTSDDLEVRQVGAVYGDHFSDPAALIGKQTTRWIRQGTALSPDMVRTKPTVFAGQKVTIMFTQPGLVVRCQGVAQEDGYTGQLITVRNELSDRLVTGRIVSSELVEVE